MSLTIETLSNIININNNILTVKELLNLFKYEFNDLYIDKFWNNIESNKWVYIDNEMLKYIGYSGNNIRIGKQTYNKLLNDNFKENIDYKSLFSKDFSMYVKTYIENSNLNTHNKTKHLIVSPKCFKKSLMMLRTSKSEEIRDYYIELEEIFNFYLQYQNKYQELKNLKIAKQLEQSKKELENKNEELELEKLKSFRLTDNLKHFTKLEKRENVYAATSKTYAAKNIFKFGKAKDCTSRLISYNTGRHADDLNYFCFIYPCYNSAMLEQLINSFLNQYRDRHSAEVFIINYKYLEKIVKFICEKYDEITDFFNSEIIEKISEIATELPIIPEQITVLPNFKKDRKSNFGKSSIIFNKDLENKKFTDKEYIRENNLICSELQYYTNNIDKQYYIFSKLNLIPQKNNKSYILDFYLCNKCYKSFKAIGELKSHFNRISDCSVYISLLNQDNENPIIYTYIRPESKTEYKYHCILNEAKQKIIYYCNKCKSKFTEKSNMVKHFDRLTDCSDTKWINKKSLVNGEKTGLKYYLNNINNEYYQYYSTEKELWINVCNRCKKESKWSTFPKEHFSRINRCKIKE